VQALVLAVFELLKLQLQAVYLYVQLRVQLSVYLLGFYVLRAPLQDTACMLLLRAGATACLCLSPCVCYAASLLTVCSAATRQLLICWHALAWQGHVQAHASASVMYVVLDVHI
jgi:hypothetical protein